MNRVSITVTLNVSLGDADVTVIRRLGLPQTRQQTRGEYPVSQQPLDQSHMTWRRSALSAISSILKTDIIVPLMGIGLAVCAVLIVAVWLVTVIITAVIVEGL